MEAAGRNFDKMHKAFNLSEVWQKVFTPLPAPSKSGRAQIALVPFGEFGDEGDTIGNQAILLFVEFIMNPHCDRLAGPCKKSDCGKYFICYTNRQNRLYCNPRCAAWVSAEKRMKDKRNAQQEKKLALAREAIREEHNVEGWEKRVSARYPKGVLSPWWLTRAVKAGKLQPPPACTELCTERSA